MPRRPDDGREMRVAVIGGGIAGLAAAWELRARAEVSIFEPGRLGGALQTSEFAGRPVDEGPDAFLTRVPDAVDLCAELGLAEELVAPEAGRTLLWTGGRLRTLPEGLALGVPRAVRPIATSGLLSPVGMLRAALDLVLPRRDLPDDLSVDDLVAGRFGSEVAARLVEPLVGSIHAARTADLSALATAPQILAVARRSRSLLLGLRVLPGGAGTGPLFLAPRAGLAALIDRLVDRLAGAGVGVHRHAVSSARPAAGGGIVVDGSERFDGVVLAVPAPIAARLLGDHAPGGLGDLSLTSVVLTTLSYQASDLPAPPGINGILVPPGEGTLMTACSFGSSKWSRWATPGTTVVRVSAGRHGDRRAGEVDDAVLVERLAGELARATGTTAGPDAFRVSRWPESFPLYRVGHLQRVDGFERHLAAVAPSITLAGSSYRGAGIPACVGTGRRAARQVVAALEPASP